MKSAASLVAFKAALRIIGKKNPETINAECGAEGNVQKMQRRNDDCQQPRPGFKAVQSNSRNNSRHRDDQEKKLIDEIKALAERCEDGVHLYLRFIGDWKVTLCFHFDAATYTYDAAVSVAGGSP